LTETEEKRIFKAAKIGIFFPLSLGSIKLIIGVITNSISVISGALDSFLDLTSTSLAYPAIRKSKIPPDDDHPYGHGKFENLFSIFQGLIIVATGLYISIEAIRRFFKPVEFDHLNAGIGIIFLSGISTFIVGNWLKKVGEKSDSIILIAEGENFLTDVYSNIGIVFALLIVKITGLGFLDTVGGLFISIIIIGSSMKIFKRSINDLLDKNLPQEIVDEITDVVERHEDQYLNFHKLRTRRAGAVKLIDLHITLCRMMHLHESHELVNHIEEEIKDKIPGSDVIIHADPCPEICPPENPCNFLSHLKSHHHRTPSGEASHDNDD